jgi:glycosyltransferase involved in cell wall biosynthesis
VYNHGRTLEPIAEKLSVHGKPILLIDDGSNAETKGYLKKAAADFPLVKLYTLDKNRGKGNAIRVGIEKARELGLSHALQIDADGQHDTDRAGLFLEQAARNPTASIAGYPVFDESLPNIRRKGKAIANHWVRIITLSPDIPDSMCGFRVYPVETVWRLFQHYRFDKRMGIEIDLLIKMSWAGFPLLFYPIKVTYPQDGISHYHYVRDNVRIAWVFIRSFFGMLFRLPALLKRKTQVEVFCG